jgi:small-conductance mechanosensitive channel
MQTVTASLSNALAWMQTAWPPWFAGLLILAVVASLLLFLHSAVFAVLGLVLRGRLAVFGETLLTRVKAPTRLGLVVIGLGLALQALPSRAGLFALIQWALLFGFVIAVGWTAIAVVNTAADLYLRRVPENSEDSALTRKHLTQVRLLRRITVIVIGFLTFAAVLMTIPSVRQYGVSLFASAGVAGLAVGLAARPLLSNLIAGVQIAVAQPIRLGDGIFIEASSATWRRSRPPMWWCGSGIGGASWCPSPISWRSRSRTGPRNPPRSSGPCSGSWATGCPWRKLESGSSPS